MSVVYFIQAGAGGPIKIGFTNYLPSIRISVLQPMNAETLVLLGEMPAPRGRDDEADIHAKFAQHRIRNEWFRPAPEILELAGRFLVVDEVWHGKSTTYIMPATALIAKLGGETAIANYLNISRQAVQDWKRRGFIPYRRVEVLRTLGQERGIEVTAEDFMPREAES